MPHDTDSPVPEPNAAKPAARGAATRTSFGRAIALVAELEAALDEEWRLLREREIDALIELAERKRALIDELEGLRPQLAARLGREGDAEGGRLRERLAGCRERNARNGALARVAAGGARATLGLLRAALVCDDLTLYDARGALSERREKRSLGKA